MPLPRCLRAGLLAAASLLAVAAAAQQPPVFAPPPVQCGCPPPPPDCGCAPPAPARSTPPPQVTVTASLGLSRVGLGASLSLRHFWRPHQGMEFLLNEFRDHDRNTTTVAAMMNYVLATPADPEDARAYLLAGGGFVVVRPTGFAVNPGGQTSYGLDWGVGISGRGGCYESQVWPGTQNCRPHLAFEFRQILARQPAFPEAGLPARWLTQPEYMLGFQIRL